jgi:hypothetical protein
MRPTVDNETVRAYLLGTLPETDAARLEQAYFADSALADEIAAVEQDLMDAYVRDELSAVERQSFEEHYLASPVHRQRTAMAAALRTAAAEHRADVAPATGAHESGLWRRSVEFLSGVPTPLRWSAMAAAVLIALVWWATAIAPDAGEDARSRQAQSDQPSNPPTVTPTPPPKAPEQPPSNPDPPIPARTTRVTFLLAQVVTRNDSQQAAFVVPPGVDEIELRFPPDLQLPAGRVLVEIRTPDEVFVKRVPATAGGSSIGNRAVTAVVPQAELPSGDYLVSLMAAAEPNVPLGRYSMRITRK